MKFVQRQLALINAHDQNYFHLIQQGVIEESITSWLQYEHWFWRLVIQAWFKELTPWPHLGWLKIKWLTLPHLFPLAKKVSSERESWRVLKKVIQPKMRHKCLSLLWWLWSRSNSLLWTIYFLGFNIKHENGITPVARMTYMVYWTNQNDFVSTPTMV